MAAAAASGYFPSGATTGAGASAVGAYGASYASGATANGLMHQPLYQLSSLPPPSSLTDGGNVVDADVLKTPGKIFK